MIALAYAAVWIFVFSVPWENVIVIPGVGALSRATGMLALGCTMVAVVVAGRVRRWHPFHMAAFTFVLWAALELLFFHWGNKIPSKFWTYVQLLAVVWMMWELAPTRHRQLGLLLAYVLGAYVAAIDTIVVYRRSGGGGHRFAAEGFNTNDLAMILALAIPMAWYLGGAFQRPFARWLCRGYLPFAIIALGLTGSRGGMLASMVGLLVVPLTMTKLSPGRLATAMVLLGVSGVLAVQYVPKAAKERLATTGADLGEGNFGGRTQLWKAGWYAFAQKPIKGYGTSTFKAAITPMLGSRALVAHNSFLSVLVELGLIGFFIYSTMIVAVFFAVLRLPRLERRFALVLGATLMVAMLPLSWEDNKSVWIILAALLGFSQAYVDRWGAAGAPPVGEAVPPAPAPAVARPWRQPLVRGRRSNVDHTV